jgi:hypothetical protein
MAHLEKSSRQTGSRIESILRGGNSVIKRQDEIDGKLEAIKGTVSDLSNQMMSMARATVQHESMASFGVLLHICSHSGIECTKCLLILQEIDDSPTDIGAVMENLVTIRCP